jgi:signal peptidase I
MDNETKDSQPPVQPVDRPSDGVKEAPLLANEADSTEDKPKIIPEEPTVTAPIDIPSPKKFGRLRKALSTILIVLAAPLIAWLLINFIFQPYGVDGPSMQTTLYDQDRLIIWKVKRTWARITNHAYIPNRGDVIVFKLKGEYEPGTSKEKQLIKRVIGLPGERVVVKNNEVMVYNQANPNGFNPDKTLPYGSVIKETTHDVDITVEANEVFVLGDNRANSEDSRRLGPIPADDIIGKLVLRILPLKEAEVF